RWAHESGVHTAARAALGDADEDVRVAAVEGLASRWTTAPGTLEDLCAAFYDPDPKVRVAVIEALTSHWPEEAEVATLIRRAEADPDGDVVLTAVLVRERHRSTPETLAGMIQQIAVGDPRADVRRAAVDAMPDDWFDFSQS